MALFTLIPQVIFPVKMIFNHLTLCLLTK